MDIRSQGNVFSFQSFLNIYILSPIAFNVCDKNCYLISLKSSCMWQVVSLLPIFKIVPFCLSKHWMQGLSTVDVYPMWHSLNFPGAYIHVSNQILEKNNIISSNILSIYFHIFWASRMCGLSHWTMFYRSLDSIHFFFA